MADCFDTAYSIRHDMKNIVGYNITITRLTNSKSLLKVIVESTTPAEKRLMTGVKATREAFQNNEIF